MLAATFYRCCVLVVISMLCAVATVNDEEPRDHQINVNITIPMTFTVGSSVSKKHNLFYKIEATSVVIIKCVLGGNDINAQPNLRWWFQRPEGGRLIGSVKPYQCVYFDENSHPPDESYVPSQRSSPKPLATVDNYYYKVIQEIVLPMEFIAGPGSKLTDEIRYYQITPGSVVYMKCMVNGNDVNEDPRIHWVFTNNIGFASFYDNNTVNFFVYSHRIARLYRLQIPVLRKWKNKGYRSGPGIFDYKDLKDIHTAPCRTCGYSILTMLPDYKLNWCQEPMDDELYHIYVTFEQICSMCQEMYWEDPNTLNKCRNKCFQTNGFKKCRRAFPTYDLRPTSIHQWCYSCRKNDKFDSLIDLQIGVFNRSTYISDYRGILVFKESPIHLKCSVYGDHVAKDPNLHWLKDGNNITDDSIRITVHADGNVTDLMIATFDAKKHTGIYKCTVRSCDNVYQGATVRLSERPSPIVQNNVECPCSDEQEEIRRCFYGKCWRKNDTSASASALCNYRAAPVDDGTRPDISNLICLPLIMNKKSFLWFQAGKVYQGSPVYVKCVLIGDHIDENPHIHWEIDSNVITDDNDSITTTVDGDGKAITLRIAPFDYRKHTAEYYCMAKHRIHGYGYARAAVRLTGLRTDLRRCRCLPSDAPNELGDYCCTAEQRYQTKCFHGQCLDRYGTGATFCKCYKGYSGSQCRYVDNDHFVIV